MGDVRIDPKKQFSKKLARWTAAFWFLFMSWLSAILIISPSTALYVVYMAVIVTAVMIINVVSYTRNSIMEKLAFTLLDKTKIEMSLGNGKKPDEGSEGGEEVDDG